MKCKHCGTINSSKDRYCKNCGKPLSAKVTCPNWKKTLPPGSKFCSNCGTKIGKPVKAHESQSRKKRGVRTEVFVIAIVVVLLAGAAGYAIYSASGGFGSNRSSTLPSTAQNPSTPLPSFSPQVEEIAAYFFCPCGACDLILAECHCDEPRGAIEVKSYISKLVSSGLSREEIIKEVETEYGHRITG
ncbi:MAG: hypothetical protein DRP87_13780 [Spirochaetes bacterium]|nr:MAG: hypothetical protein DRP87_13780 [Spirochaetota bacterium]